MIKAIYQLIIALPELFKLISAIQKHHEQQEQKRKIKDDLQAIEKAFNEQDPEALNRVFNNKN